MFGFHFEIRGRAANWVVSIVFMAVGGAIIFWLPGIMQPSPDRHTAWAITSILGGVFLGLGALIFVWMVGDLYLGLAQPEQRDIWYWWGSFVEPLAAAGLFAIPASLAFPAMLLAYLLRPNAFFPADSPDPSNNLIVGAVFSVVGLLVVVLIYFLGRSMYRRRPRLQRRKA